MTESNKFYLYKEIGSAISKNRKLNKLSQEALAEKVGLSRASIVNIEKGRQFLPIYILWQISETLNVEIDKLIPRKISNSTDLNPSLTKIISRKEKQGVLNDTSTAYLTSFLTKQLG